MNNNTKFGRRVKWTGFTIIELLVVLIIVSTLAAVTFGVITSTRQRAGQTACLSNLRQLALAVQQYAHDNDDYIPPYNSKFGTSTNDGIPLIDHGSDLVSSLNPYIHNRSIWFCPADIYARTHSTAGSVNHLYLSYATGPAWYDGGPGLFGVLGKTRIDMTSPSSSAAPSQGLALFSDDSWGYFMNGDGKPPPYSHNGRFMFVMFDGHARSFSAFNDGFGP